MKASALVLLLLGVLHGVRALASEESQALGARALIELDARRTTEAMALLDRAVAADPADALVRYQRGVMRAQLGDFPGAIADLRAALAIQPELPPAALELGVALSEIHAHEEAVSWLQRAQQTPALEAQASFFLAVAQLRLNLLDEAQQSFERARLRDTSLDLPAQYYLGVIAYRRQNLADAEARFRAVERGNPESAMGRESVEFLELIRGSRRTYQAFGRLALEYDSNVTLAPADTLPGAVSKEGDGRFVLNAGGTYVPWTYRRARLALSYEFFQSLHFRVTDFNLQDHRPAVQLLVDFGRVSCGALGRYDYYLRTDDSFLQEATFFPWAALREDGFGHTDVYYRMQRRDYKQLSFAVLDGFYHEVGVRQFIELGGPERELWAGYEFGTNDPVDMGSDLFRFETHQLEVGLQWLMPYAVTLATGYRYAHQDYDSASGVFDPPGRRRRDHDHRVVVSFERPLSELSEHLFMTAAYFGTFNQSNKDDFEYDRQIGSIALEVRL